jgi:hypothetical protein
MPSTLLRWLCWSCVCGMLLSQTGRADAIGNGLLQTKQRTAEYVVAIGHLRLRNPAQDARRDLASGDRGLYCVGTIGCWPIGVVGDVPDDTPIRATAATGCVIMGGDLEMAYRAAEERYVEAYNAAKVVALRDAIHVRDRALSDAP